ncbi:MAG: DedA family protein [Gemmatimonadetes bacterium]|nr:DedA family protein [Gemmatimonadota bacterium]
MIETLSSWLGSVVTWLVNTIGTLGYPGITVLMALESSFFPFPSEVVLPPAGYLAAKGQMNAYAVAGAGILGSVLGAVFNYVVAVRLGRPLLHKYHRMLLIKEHSLDRAEAFFRRHGEISTFVGRLIPVIRQYISLPAGLAHMRLELFVLYTALGAGIWCAVLTWIGWYLGTHAEVLQDQQVHRYVTGALLVLAPVIVVIVTTYVVHQRRRTRREARVAGVDE